MANIIQAQLLFLESVDASKDIQIKLDSASYGLSWKIVLTRVYPG